MNIKRELPLLKKSDEILPHWSVWETSEGSCKRYQVRDAQGSLVAADVTCLQHARLIALAPLLLENFDLLKDEAYRALHHMVDASQGMLEIEEVAEDPDGTWEEAAPGAPSFAQWLLGLEELRDAIGAQGLLPERAPRQVSLALED